VPPLKPKLKPKKIKRLKKLQRMLANRLKAKLLPHHHHQLKKKKEWIWAVSLIEIMALFKSNFHQILFSYITFIKYKTKSII
jgi:hypothetical protein